MHPNESLFKNYFYCIKQSLEDNKHIIRESIMETIKTKEEIQPERHYQDTKKELNIAALLILTLIAIMILYYIYG